MTTLSPQEQVIIDALREEGKPVHYRAFTAKLRETGRGGAVRAIDGLRVNGQVKLSLGLVEGASSASAFIRLPEHPAPVYTQPEEGVSNGS